MNRFLDVISILGSFMVVFGVLFLIQNITLGQISVFNSIIVFKIFYLKDLIFTAISLTIINKYVTFYIPDRGREKRMHT
jgi:hypothetical protein